MNVGENLEWIGYAIVDQSMRIMGGLKPVKNARVPVRVFDKTNIGQAGPQVHVRLGHDVRQRLPQALGPAVAVEEVEPPRLELRRLSKSFGGTQALRGVDLSLLPGEVHGLLGENGSGKSTLIKILAGFHDPDGGELLIDGEAVRLPLAPGQFRELGLSFVHQDLGLIESLSVLENLRMAELASSRSRFGISWRRERQRARETFERYGLRIDPTAIVGDLKPVERALLAIVRAIEEIRGVGARPGACSCSTSRRCSCRARGSSVLFSLVREQRPPGRRILFVSHDLDEVREITDRVTVLRDGALVGTVGTRETSETTFVEMIIGRQLAALADVEHARPDRSGASASSVERPDRRRSCATSRFEMHDGEVVGLTGLIGSGFEEVAVPALRRAAGARGPARARRPRARPAAADAARGDRGPASR